ncbi:hypothetical protein H8E77_35045 [bacterium]|nr:hypothetical protein [bacterium]
MNTSVGHSLKTASGILAVLLVVSIAFAAQESVWGENKVTSTWNKIKDTSGDSNVIGALVEEALAEQDIPEKAVIKYVMSPGDYVDDSSVLDDFFPQEFDIFVFILVGNGSWSMEIEDC